VSAGKVVTVPEHHSMKLYVSGQLHASATVPLVTDLLIPFGWVGPRSSLSVVEKRKTPA